ncbi:uncharacterized protein LOC121374232 isoform X5 [Gigantopelta aegis]|uniref:uncharacterized protein LOC121374232 isoform X5 n=1 Tax=Gigantopelta aegis TaxID=1735272 RepID=UPI001B88A4F9|nr:uncharacterized protein LOC121374232 isoform X5 [Gigantopelta aegis]
MVSSSLAMLPSFGVRERQLAILETLSRICGRRSEDCPVSCSCRLPNSKYCILREAELKEAELLLEKREQHKIWAPLKINRPGFVSSSTPTVPYTAADLAYSDVNKQAGDLTTTDLVCFDREKEKNKFREFDASNRQHSGKNNSRRSISLEKVNFDNDKDELRPIKNTFSTNKQNQGRPNGLRGNFIRTDQLLNPKNNVSFQSVGREPEDLIAMGTIWSPNVQQRSSTTTTASTKSLALPPSYNTLAAQPIRKGPNGLTARPLLGSQNQSTSKKEVEPRYSDPLTGAPASFQQRLIELSSLESETIRWERTKKIKKKSKADRDS